MCTTNIVVFSIYNLYFSMILQYASYNVNGLRKSPKRKSIFTFLNKNNTTWYYSKKLILVQAMKNFGPVSREVK